MLCCLLGTSCGNSGFISLVREDLFFLNAGEMENQFNVFFNPQASRTLRNDIFYDEGLFYVLNGNAKKLMEFTPFGEITLLLYNPEANPLPVLLKKADPETDATAIISRRAIETDFSDTGSCTVDSEKNIYVDDVRAPDDEDANLTPHRRVIKRYDRLGNFLDFIGSNGRNGRAFPAIESFYLTKNDELVVVCITAKGRTVYWFDGQFSPLFEIEFDNSLLPLPQEPDAIAIAGKIVPDLRERRLYLLVTYFKNIRDSATKLVNKVVHTESRIYTFDLATERYSDSCLSIPAETADQNDPLFSKSVQQTAIPFNLLGITEDGIFYLFKKKNQTSHEILVIDSQTKNEKRLRLSIDDTQILSMTFKISAQGMLYALLIENSGVRITRWRSDRISFGG